MLSLFLAKVLGVYLVVISLSVLFNRKRFLAVVDHAHNTLSMYASGAIILLLGLLMINVHNIWTADYRGVITFLGWITVFKGLVRVCWGEKAIRWGKSAFHAWWYNPLLIIFLLIGIWLTAVGYGWM